MSLLDRNGAITDEWVRGKPGDDAPALIVEQSDLIAAIAQRLPGQRIGLSIPNIVHPVNLAPEQDALDLIAIAFPKFNDGRGFSIAKSLRAQGYKGIIRATGALIPDLFAFALESGFDEIELSDEQAARQPVEQWLHALTLIGASYQDGEDGTVSIFKRRRAAAAVDA